MTLKIALINTFYPPYNFGGDGVYVRRFAHALARIGCEVSVLHDKDTYRAIAPKPLGDLEPLDEPPGVSVTALESPLGPIATLLTQQTGRPIANGAAIDRFFSNEFDVTHFHNVSSVGGPGILSKGSGVRLYTAHEHWLVCPTHILWRRNREICDAKECLSCQLTYKRPPQLWRNTDFLERQAAQVDSFIALSRSSAENHKRFGFSREMTVLPSFMPDVGAVPRVTHPERAYVLFVGRLEKLKGLQDVIPAFRDADFEFLIVGDGEYRAELERIAGGAPNIKFYGRRSADELVGLYAHAAAVILPSVCYEVFPLVALEAFRAGTPIVARNLGPFPEIINETAAGFLFDRPAEAAQSARRLVADSAMRADLGRKARAAYETRWTEEAALVAYLNHVAAVAARKGRKQIVEKAAALASKLAGST